MELLRVLPQNLTGSFMDYGMFLQSVMPSALGVYPHIVKSELDYPENSILICGMAPGYEDPDAPVNGYHTPREDVDGFTRFFK